LKSWNSEGTEEYETWRVFIFRDLTLWRLVEFHWNFGKESNTSILILFSDNFPYYHLTLKTEALRSSETSTPIRLDVATSQKTVPFIVIAVRTSNQLGYVILWAILYIISASTISEHHGIRHKISSILRLRHICN
jgi:hypothetical protein